MVNFSSKIDVLSQVDAKDMGSSHYSDDSFVRRTAIPTIYPFVGILARRNNGNPIVSTIFFVEIMARPLVRHPICPTVLVFRQFESLGCLKNGIPIIPTKSLVGIMGCPLVRRAIVPKFVGIVGRAIVPTFVGVMARAIVPTCTTPEKGLLLG